MEQIEELKAKAKEQFISKNYLAAIEIYSKAISLNDKISLLHSNRAQCYRKLSRFDESIEDCQTAIELEENNIKAHYTMGIINRNKPFREGDSVEGRLQGGSQHQQVEEGLGAVLVAEEARPGILH